MKLLFYSPRFYPLLGGLERVVEAWATELTKQGVEVCVVTSTPADKADDFVFPVYRQLPFLKLVKLMRGVDTVVQFNVALKGLPAWRLSGKPLVISHHTLLVETGKPAAWQQRLKLRVANRLAASNICCSNYIAAQFSKAVVVHSPYHERLFSNQQQERQKRSLVFAGRLVTDKGVDLLLQALAKLDGRLYNCLTIIGDGPERAALESVATALLPVEKIRFTGTMTGQQLVDLLNQSEVMIVPSLVEPFGITVLEGLACGCRMVVSNAGGLPEAAGGFAELFESGDVLSLTAAIEKAMTRPRITDPLMVAAHLSRVTVPCTAGRFLEVVEKAVQ